MRKQYDTMLKTLGDNLVRMADGAEDAIKKALKALVGKDRALAESVIKSDEKINDYEKQIERQALKLIYREQPVAEDLRHVSTALKMITDIERIGDQAADICTVALKIMHEPYCKDLVHIPAMAEKAIEMVSGSVRAYANGDLALANEIIKKDDGVDDLFEVIKNEMIMIIKASPEYAEQVIYLMMIAKYIERIGDHAVNIAEWVIFNLTGTHRNLQVL
ncbi:phosphate transport system regulatory protein PhoU [Clostridia bacterium]|nr:phosphate transport system regulatory protein PhoU [Clostridia bacterium]